MENRNYKRLPYSELRDREYLKPKEVDAMLKAAKKTGRSSTRNYTMILIAYRHGLRVGELVRMKWSDVDFDSSKVFIRRLKGCISGEHFLDGSELRALRQLRRDHPSSEYLFVSNRGGVMTERNFCYIVKTIGELARLDFPVHPHMLRHATGYYLANKGTDTRSIQAYLGHRSIQSTVRYTEVSSERFRNLWSDDG